MHRSSKALVFDLQKETLASFWKFSFGIKGQTTSWEPFLGYY